MNCMKSRREWLNKKYNDRMALLIVSPSLNRQKVIDSVTVTIGDCSRQVHLEFDFGVPYCLKDKNRSIGKHEKKERANSIEKARILRDTFQEVLDRLENIENDIEKAKQ